MIELSLVTLLQSMAPHFCEYKRDGLDTTKATLLAYSDVHDQYASKEIRRVVRDGKGFKEISIAIVATTCPIDAIQ